MSIRMTFSPSSKLSDIEALLDSYGVRLSRYGLDLQIGPLWSLEGRSIPTTLSDVILEIDPNLELCMVRWASPAHRESKARWPFFVEAELRVIFSVGDQWWQYDFSPGKTYTERTAGLTADERTTHSNEQTAAIQTKKESS